MKGKLIKQDGIGIQTIDGIDYYLILDGKVYHTNPVTLALCNGGKLSKKNCEAVANGYDLDELRKKSYEKYDKDDLSLDELIQRSGGFLVGYESGFQKALEILSDKKFSEDDMINSYHKGFFSDNSTFKERIVEVNDYIKSLQQTEWDVEIETTCDGVQTGLCMPEICDCNIITKLDNEGCLILKRI
jgi:hypothetical protein